MSSNIRIDQLEDAIKRKLNLYSGAILTGVRDAADVTVKEMVQTTKQRKSTPRARGKYVRCMASQVGANTTVAQSRIWYVKDPCYRVTHLLNNGHRTRRAGGRVSGDEHVTDAAKVAFDKFENRVKEVIRREGN